MLNPEEKTRHIEKYWGPDALEESLTLAKTIVHCVTAITSTVTHHGYSSTTSGTASCLAMSRLVLDNHHHKNIATLNQHMYDSESLRQYYLTMKTQTLMTRMKPCLQMIPGRGISMDT